MTPTCPPDHEAPVPIGPIIPPHLLSQQEQRGQEKNGSLYRSSSYPANALRASQTSHGSAAEDEDSAISADDAYMPALPPDMKKYNETPAFLKPSPPRRVMGPSFPTRPPVDSDDEDIGPMPPSEVSVLLEQSGIDEFLERERRREQQAAEASQPKKLEREAWMLAPPTSSELLGSLDPTRLRTKRTLGGGASRGNNKEGMELWTETPQEKLERLKAEISGKRKRVGVQSEINADEKGERDRKRRRDEEIERRVQEHNKGSDRMASMLDMHASKQKSKGEGGHNKDDVIWDHERDMSIGGRLMDEGKRKDIIKDAKGLGGRFERGRTGGYL
ncbi:hypothetical protein DACRYDRAFT_101581 [Dacryopinax primogenitus]|uniref:DUF3752 domain-containing protein n=1 Tax=Dacryopinax primogenitus (strain DJM 731) TaxID=1858805 RepID=M5FQ52_DACPD|nr:uncharacterized protein DACRYDRAFT_101581 [Dacryopinax primogenitus]EJT98975.1 hypothetical protein DACRYDRAFT_101581 [Dacryopinax primogenitus]